MRCKDYYDFRNEKNISKDQVIMFIYKSLLKTSDVIKHQHNKMSYKKVKKLESDCFRYYFVKAVGNGRSHLFSFRDIICG